MLFVLQRFPWISCMHHFTSYVGHALMYHCSFGLSVNAILEVGRFRYINLIQSKTFFVVQGAWSYSCRDASYCYLQWASSPGNVPTSYEGNWRGISQQTMQLLFPIVGWRYTCEHNNEECWKYISLSLSSFFWLCPVGPHCWILTDSTYKAIVSFWPLGVGTWF